jgi:hypothetical protein
MNRRHHRTFLKVEALEPRDAPSSVLLGMPAAPTSGHEGGAPPLVRLRRVVGDAVQGGPVASGQAQRIDLASFNTRGTCNVVGMGTPTVIAGDAQWVELSSFQWGVGLGMAEANAMSVQPLPSRESPSWTPRASSAT